MYIVHSGLVGIIDIPLVLTVMLCSDSEVTCGLGGGQFHTFKSHSYVHNRIIQEKKHHSIPHRSHANAPRTRSNMNDSYSNTRIICSHVKVKLNTPFSEDFVDLVILICLDV